MRPSASTLEPELSKAELAAIVHVLRTAGLRDKHLEIGTAAGGTLREMMSAYPAEARPPFVVIDPFTYFPDQRDIVERNLRSVGVDPASVDFRVGFAWPILKTALAAGETFDFIFIDGDHNAMPAMQDLMWTRLLNVGGYVCLHDYRRKFRGVVWATERFLARHGDAYERVATADSLVVLRKTRRSARPEVSMADVAIGGLLQKIHRLQWSLDKRFGRADQPL